MDYVDKTGELTHSSRYPAGLPVSDRSKWDAMTPNQRDRALKRIMAFQGWSKKELSIDDAVEKSGLSRSRFYRLAADWRAAPALDTLGAAAGSGSARSKLDPNAVNALQAVVAKVVRLNEGSSVSQLVRLMVASADIPKGAKIPGKIQLRRIVEQELRRVREQDEAGAEIRFDCTAINLPQANGRPHLMFVCLDKGTRAILGFAVSPAANAAHGYRLAAADALRRVSTDLLMLPWAARTKQILMVAGDDKEESAELVERMLKAGVGGSVQLTQVPKRYGKYFREVVGTRLGRVAITPARTERGLASPDGGDMTPWSDDDASAVVGSLVEQHNAELLTARRLAAGRRLPGNLKLALQLLRGDELSASDHSSESVNGGAMDSE